MRDPVSFTPSATGFGSGDTLVLFDSTVDPSTGDTGQENDRWADVQRVEVSIRSTKASSSSGFIYKEKATATEDWETVASLTGSADTTYVRNWKRNPSLRHFRVEWTDAGGAPAPTYTKLGVQLIYDREGGS